MNWMKPTTAAYSIKLIKISKSRGVGHSQPTWGRQAGHESKLINRGRQCVSRAKSAAGETRDLLEDYLDWLCTSLVSSLRAWPESDPASWNLSLENVKVKDKSLSNNPNLSRKPNKKDGESKRKPVLCRGRLPHTPISGCPPNISTSSWTYN